MILAIKPGNTQAAGFESAAGYTSDNCALSSLTDEDTCFRGVRISLGLSMFDKSKSNTSNSSDSSSGNMFNSMGRVNLSGGSYRSPGEFIAALLFLFVLMLIIYGLVLGGTVFFSQKMRFGIETSYDLMKSEKHTMARTHLSFLINIFLTEKGWFNLRFGFGPSYTKISLAGEDETKNLATQGFYSRWGLGLAPPEGSGPFLFTDFEQEATVLKTAGKLDKDEQDLFPNTNKFLSVTLGWRHGF
jgi:hypothetical protein